jgi:hypothetical protein
MPSGEYVHTACLKYQKINSGATPPLVFEPSQCVKLRSVDSPTPSVPASVPPCCLGVRIRAEPPRLEEGVLTDDIPDRSGGFRTSAGPTGATTSLGDTWGAACAAVCGSSAPPGTACAALCGCNARATRPAGCLDGASCAALCSSGPSAPFAWRWPNAGRCR